MECKRCGAVDTPHYANDSTCKECRKAKVKANRAARIEHYRAYDRGRGSRQGPEYLAKYRAENPEKYKAHSAVSYALRAGKLQKLDACEHCGETKNIVGHHVAYDLPLAVTWLCQGCHITLHKEHEMKGEIA